MHCLKGRHPRERHLTEAEPPNSMIRYYFSLGVRDGEKALLVEDPS